MIKEEIKINIEIVPIFIGISIFINIIVYTKLLDVEEAIKNVDKNKEN